MPTPEELAQGARLMLRYPYGLDRTKYPATVIGFWEDNRGIYVRFDHLPFAYSFPRTYFDGAHTCPPLKS